MDPHKTDLNRKINKKGSSKINYLKNLRFYFFGAIAFAFVCLIQFANSEFNYSCSFGAAHDDTFFDLILFSYLYSPFSQPQIVFSCSQIPWNERLTTTRLTSLAVTSKNIFVLPTCKIMGTPATTIAAINNNFRKFFILFLLLLAPTCRGQQKGKNWWMRRTSLVGLGGEKTLINTFGRKRRLIDGNQFWEGGGGSNWGGKDATKLLTLLNLWSLFSVPSAPRNFNAELTSATSVSFFLFGFLLYSKSDECLSIFVIFVQDLVKVSLTWQFEKWLQTLRKNIVHTLSDHRNGNFMYFFCFRSNWHGMLQQRPTEPFSATTCTWIEWWTENRSLKRAARSE